LSSFSVTRSNGRGSNGHDSSSFGIVEFIIGIILIMFAIPLVWMNERNCAIYHALLEKGKKAVVDGGNAEQIDP
jgi:hypothetical protein